MSRNFYVYSFPWRYSNRDGYQAVEDWIYIKSALEYFCSGFFTKGRDRRIIVCDKEIPLFLRVIYCHEVNGYPNLTGSYRPLFLNYVDEFVLLDEDRDKYYWPAYFSNTFGNDIPYLIGYCGRGIDMMLKDLNLIIWK